MCAHIHTVYTLYYHIYTTHTHTHTKCWCIMFMETQKYFPDETLKNPSVIPFPTEPGSLPHCHLERSWFPIATELRVSRKLSEGPGRSCKIGVTYNLGLNPSIIRCLQPGWEPGHHYDKQKVVIIVSDTSHAQIWTNSLLSYTPPPCQCM